MFLNVTLVNDAWVNSMLLTGQGFSQLRDITASLEMPCMAKEPYQNSHRNLSAFLGKKMQAAGEEDVAIAIQAGEVDDVGVCVIAVVTDGAWRRRSYGTNYNTPYLDHVSLVLKPRRFYLQVQETLTVAFVIGHHLKVNQQIPTCVTKSGTNRLLPWKLTIVQGFINSIDMHNLKYDKLIVFNSQYPEDCYERLPIQRTVTNDFIQRTVTNDFQSRGLLRTTSNPEDCYERLPIQRTVTNDFQSRGLLRTTSNPEDCYERLPIQRTVRTTSNPETVTKTSNPEDCYERLPIQRTVTKDFQSRGLLRKTSNPEDCYERLPIQRTVTKDFQSRGLLRKTSNPEHGYERLPIQSTVTKDFQSRARTTFHQNGQTCQECSGTAFSNQRLNMDVPEGNGTNTETFLARGRQSGPRQVSRAPGSLCENEFAFIKRDLRISPALYFSFSSCQMPKPKFAETENKDEEPPLTVKKLKGRIFCVVFLAGKRCNEYTETATLSSHETGATRVKTCKSSNGQNAYVFTSARVCGPVASSGDMDGRSSGPYPRPLRVKACTRTSSLQVLSGPHQEGCMDHSVLSHTEVIFSGHSQGLIQEKCERNSEEAICGGGEGRSWAGVGGRGTQHRSVYFLLGHFLLLSPRQHALPRHERDTVREHENGLDVTGDLELVVAVIKAVMTGRRERRSDTPVAACLEVDAAPTGRARVCVLSKHGRRRSADPGLIFVPGLCARTTRGMNPRGNPASKVKKRGSDTGETNMHA
ncbi:hypothetical protein PR048_008566 [Dryococelus australis]|uniref:Mutator-like transposase domain-containing protein n=1 Tax=Dryococelus australis TaxID=614101 RepID=A0ABQ9HXT1_9NEOP|nr:hypothetical protein PR048_008566 [Dryococelus australis]